MILLSLVLVSKVLGDFLRHMVLVGNKGLNLSLASSFGKVCFLVIIPDLELVQEKCQECLIVNLPQTEQ